MDYWDFSTDPDHRIRIPNHWLKDPALDTDPAFFVSRCQQKISLKKVLYLLRFVGTGTFAPVSKITISQKELKKIVEIKVFLLFLLVDGNIRMRTNNEEKHNDPDLQQWYIHLFEAGFILFAFVMAKSVQMEEWVPRLCQNSGQDGGRATHKEEVHRIWDWANIFQKVPYPMLYVHNAGFGFIRFLKYVESITKLKHSL